ncbi:MAG: hypothetical protein E6K16_07215, partial [Methanobacteriota archaeon]
WTSRIPRSRGSTGSAPRGRASRTVRITIAPPYGFCGGHCSGGLCGGCCGGGCGGHGCCGGM